MARAPKVLVVAAWEPELARFRERLEAAAATDPAGGLSFEVEALGVGLVEAAIGMTQCIVRHRPALALLLGTCGLLLRADRRSSRVGDVVVGSRIRLLDGGIATGTSQVPGPMPAETSLDGAVHDALVEAGARSVQIANTIGITVDDALAVRLAAGAEEVEHLEAFAFARACASAGVRCGVVLGIANVVGSNGRAEWLANHTRASASAADLAWSARASLAVILRTSTTTRSPERA